MFVCRTECQVHVQPATALHEEAHPRAAAPRGPFSIPPKDQVPSNSQNGQKRRGYPLLHVRPATNRSTLRGIFGCSMPRIIQYAPCQEPGCWLLFKSEVEVPFTCTCALHGCTLRITEVWPGVVSELEANQGWTMQQPDPSRGGICGLLHGDP